MGSKGSKLSREERDRIATQESLRFKARSRLQDRTPPYLNEASQQYMDGILRFHLARFEKRISDLWKDYAEKAGLLHVKHKEECIALETEFDENWERDFSVIMDRISRDLQAVGISDILGACRILPPRDYWATKKPFPAKVEEPSTEKGEEPLIEKVNQSLVETSREMCDWCGQDRPRKIMVQSTAKLEEPSTEKSEESSIEKGEKPLIEKLNQSLAQISREMCGWCGKGRVRKIWIAQN
ncbi:hypothetical protein B0T21DRAFT_343599 [Apiosordaria backusii]|uniref:Uncharacterized protein n=1 Tax=Apiosordaria backusii TaxID=314023 RepID=A0AA40EYR5_9PEZI|nr:hypothetical protein B0T21DRAFT_343599 [Apiosordaria backusii]